MEKVKSFKSKSGKDCYLSGVRKEGEKWIATVRYIESMELKEVPFYIIEKYL